MNSRQSESSQMRLVCCLLMCPAKFFSLFDRCQVREASSTFALCCSSFPSGRVLRGVCELSGGLGDMCVYDRVCVWQCVCMGPIASNVQQVDSAGASLNVALRCRSFPSARLL